MSEYLRDETRRLLGFDRPIDVVHNYFEPRPTLRTRDEVRQELGVTDEVVVLHSSNLRPVKRVDLLLEAAARVRPRESFRLVILAGEGFAPFADDVRRLGLEGQVMVLERVTDIEEYLQAADLGLFASDSESFCLSILEAMCFGCPSVATRVGGIPEVVEDGISGLLVPPGDAAGLARAVEALIADPTRRAAMGAAARRARDGPLLGRRHRARLRGDLSAGLRHLSRLGEPAPGSRLLQNRRSATDRAFRSWRAGFCARDGPSNWGWGQVEAQNIAV